MNSIPYSRLALIYDRVMAHVNYKMWAQHINTLLQFSDIKVRSILDISCGTGKHIKFLSSKRREIVGADLSFQMLKAAQVNNNKGKTPFITNDARQTAFKANAFDAVVMMYDSINYMLEKSDVILLFDEVCRILKTGGIFIFDFVTEQALTDSYDDYYESNSWDGLAYERHSWFSKKDKFQHNEFIFLFNGKSYKESHIQIIHDLNEWRSLVKKSKMQLSHEFSNFSLLAPDKYSERIHFVCKKVF